MRHAKETQMTQRTTKDPVADRAAKRRAIWEAERILQIRKLVADGLMTEREALERGASALIIRHWTAYYCGGKV